MRSGVYFLAGFVGFVGFGRGEGEIEIMNPPRPLAFEDLSHFLRIFGL